MSSGAAEKPNSSTIKKTLKELECMERRLNVVLEGCLTPEELAARKKDRYESERKKLLALLDQIKTEVSERDALIEKNGKDKDSIQKNAQARSNLKDAKEILDFLKSEVTKLEVKVNKKPDEKKEKLYKKQKAQYDHAEKMYKTVAGYFNAHATDPEASTHNELFEGLDMSSPGDSSSSSSSSSSTSGSISVVGGGGKSKKGQFEFDETQLSEYRPSEFEDQWQELIQEEQQMEDQYLDQISSNLATLKELAIDAGNELDKQEVMMNDIEDKMEKNKNKLDGITKRTEDTARIQKQSSRWLYIVIIVIIAVIVLFVLMKFVF